MTSSECSGRWNSARWLELLCVLTLSLSGIGLFAAGLGVFHAPQIWVAGFLLTFAYGRFTQTISTSSPQPAPLWHLVLVIAVGLLFRLPPFVYVLGGQDQGLYFNMAMELASSGGFLPTDPVLASISDATTRATYLEGNTFRPAVYLPGIYVTADGLEFQFYRLFPVWLGLFADLFGVKGAAYGLTFLSLVSLLFFQRLAHLVSGSATAGLVAGILLAVNPLHAFFSKFPLTEVPTLAFSAMSFTYLATFWRASGSRAHGRFIALSAISIGMLFLTRITGFMYLPFVLAIAILAALFDVDQARRQGVTIWAALVVLLYTFSVLYGLEWSTRYSTDIYIAAFASTLGGNWTMLLLAAGVGAILAWLGAWAIASRESIRLGVVGRVEPLAAPVLPLLVLAVAALGAYKAYRLGFTEAYATDPWLGGRWGLSGQGYRSLRSTSLVVSAMYLSPFVFIGIFLCAFRASLTPLLYLLGLFVTWWLGYAAVLVWSVPYQPYYARYQISEVVPYALLFVVCTWALLDSSRLRSALGWLLLAGGLYSVVLVSLQVGKNEHQGVLESMDKITARFDTGDLVIVDRQIHAPQAVELTTAMLLTYRLNVMGMHRQDLATPEYLHSISSPFQEVYFLTKDAAAPEGFETIDSVRFVENAFKHGIEPPISLWRRADSRVFIHKLDESARPVAFGVGRRGVQFLKAGWSDPEAWGVWTNSTTAELLLESGKAGECSGQSELRISGRTYVNEKAPRQRLRFLVNDVVVLEKVASLESSQVVAGIPMPAGALEQGQLRLSIETPDATSPLSIGAGSDGRTLAFGLERVEFFCANPSPSGG